MYDTELVKGSRFNITSDQQYTSILNCEPTEDCQLFCNYANGCNNIKLNCPSNHKCYIQCYNPNDILSGNSCNSLTINATKSSNLQIDVFQQSQQLINSIIYAPSHINTDNIDLQCVNINKEGLAQVMSLNVCANNKIYNSNNPSISDELQCPCNSSDSLDMVSTSTLLPINSDLTSTKTSDTENILHIFVESDPFILIADTLLIATVALIILLTTGQCIAHHRASYYNTDNPPYYHIMFYFITVGSGYSQILFTIVELCNDGIMTLSNLLCLLFVVIPLIVSIIVSVIFICYGSSVSNSFKYTSHFDIVRYLSNSNKIYFIVLTIVSMGIYPAMIIASSNLFHLRIFSLILSKSQKHQLQKYRFFITTILQDIPMLIIGLDIEFNQNLSINGFDINQRHSDQVYVVCFIMIILTICSILISMIMCMGILSFPKWCCFFCEFQKKEKLKMHVKTLSTVADFNHDDIFNYDDINDDESTEQSLLFEFVLYHNHFTYHHQYTSKLLKETISSTLKISPKSFEIYAVHYPKDNQDGIDNKIEFWMQLYLGKLLLYTPRDDITEFADIKSKILSFSTYTVTPKATKSKLCNKFIHTLCNDLKFDSYEMSIAIKCMSSPDMIQAQSTFNSQHTLSTPNTFSGHQLAIQHSGDGHSTDHSADDNKKDAVFSTPITVTAITTNTHHPPPAMIDLNGIDARVQLATLSSASPHITPPHITPPSATYQNNSSEHRDSRQHYQMQMAQMNQLNVNMNNNYMGPGPSSLSVPRGAKFSMSESAMSDDIYGPYNPNIHPNNLNVSPAHIPLPSASITPMGSYRNHDNIHGALGVPVLSEVEETYDNDDEVININIDQDGILSGSGSSDSSSSSVYNPNMKGSTFQDIHAQFIANGDINMENMNIGGSQNYVE